MLWATARGTKNPGGVPSALIDSKRANARSSVEVTREKSEEIDRDRAKLSSDGGAKRAEPVEGDAARATLVWYMASV